MLTASAVSSTTYSSTCEAEIKVLRMSARGPRFSFVAKRSGSQIQVFAITVRADGDVICRVSGRKEDGTIELHRGDWTYGDVPPGFKLETVCKPLVRGKRYGIEVVGSCLGSSSFKFEPPPDEERR
jgi:hypothetical protein